MSALAAERLWLGDVINATPYHLYIYDAAGRMVFALGPTGYVARLEEQVTQLGERVVDQIRIPWSTVTYGAVTGIPAPAPDVWYVVPVHVAVGATDRSDLLVCGPAVLDERGRRIGALGLSRPHPGPRPLIAPAV